MDLINFCPDPSLQYYDVKLMNSKSPKVLSEEILMIYDFFQEHADLIVPSVRKIQKYVIGREKENPRIRNSIKDALRFLEKESVIKIIYPPSNHSIDVSKIELINEQKLIEIVGEDEYSEIKFTKDNHAYIAKIVKRLYVDVLWDKIPEVLKKLEKNKNVCIDICNSDTVDKYMSDKLNIELVNINYKIECYEKLLKYLSIPPEAVDPPPDS
jgi:hypothetical protein